MLEKMASKTTWLYIQFASRLLLILKKRSKILHRHLYAVKYLTVHFCYLEQLTESTERPDTELFDEGDSFLVHTLRRSSNYERYIFSMKYYIHYCYDFETGVLYVNVFLQNNLA